MSANGAFVGTVTAGYSSGNFYTTGLVKIGDNYYVAGDIEYYHRYVDYTGRLYYWDSSDREWVPDTNVGTPFDTVPADLITYLSNNNFTLMVE